MRTLVYEKGTNTIRIQPENYCLAHQVNGIWEIYPHEKAQLKIDVEKTLNGELQQEIKQLKDRLQRTQSTLSTTLKVVKEKSDKLHKRNMQIKDLETQVKSLVETNLLMLENR